MFDRFNRKINYLRVSVTDRCNLRCTYCMPEEGVTMLSHSSILSYEEIFKVVESCVEMGIDKVRITGGEPLVRKGMVNFISIIAKIEGIKDLSLTTNGILLHEFAEPLFNVGLKRINISLDTLNHKKFKTLTRTGNLDDVLHGIEKAIEIGYKPIKINCVIEKNSSEPDAKEVAGYCEKKNLEIRFIRKMDLHKGEFSIVEGGNGGNCVSCNRLRLTANGLIKPCLFNDISFNVRELGIKEALKMALLAKPECGTKSYSGKFYEIGG